LFALSQSVKESSPFRKVAHEPLMDSSLKVLANVSPSLTVYTVPSTSTWARVPELKTSIRTTVWSPDVVLDPPVGVGGGEPAGDTLGVAAGVEIGDELETGLAPENGFWNGSRPENTRVSVGDALGDGSGEVTAPGTTPGPGCRAELGELFVPPERRRKATTATTTTGSRIRSARRSRGVMAIGRSPQGLTLGLGLDDGTIPEGLGLGTGASVPAPG
jgi:hypothetical protein